MLSALEGDFGVMGVGILGGMISWKLYISTNLEVVVRDFFSKIGGFQA